MIQPLSQHISTAQCKNTVSPVLMHWRYCSLALHHRYIVADCPRQTFLSRSHCVKSPFCQHATEEVPCMVQLSAIHTSPHGRLILTTTLGDMRGSLSWQDTPQFSKVLDQKKKKIHRGERLCFLTGHPWVNWIWLKLYPWLGTISYHLSLLSPHPYVILIPNIPLVR